jgi:hypothetical protein
MTDAFRQIKDGALLQSGSDTERAMAMLVVPALHYTNTLFRPNLLINTGEGFFLALTLKDQFIPPTVRREAQ